MAIASSYGGKAANLVELAAAGFDVPPAYVIPARVGEEHLDRVLAPDEGLEALLRESPARLGPDRLQELATRVRQAPLSESLRQEVIAAATELRRHTGYLAIRSSSMREDQDDASAAGMHETHLNPPDDDALIDAIRDCWASLFAPRVLAYLHSLGETRSTGVGIVIQALVPAEISGVLFTMNPLTGDASEVVIDAAYGLGSAAADGRVSPDTLRVDKATRVPRDRIIGEKAIRVRVAEEGGVRDEPVSEQERAELTLDEEQIDRLLSLGLAVEEYFHGPRDLEFAIVAGRIWLLQARPITAAVQPGTRRWKSRRTGGVPRSQIVWSNVNVGEALPGVATPLTWSVLSAFSEHGFRRAFRSLGCKIPTDVELVGNFRGRIYLNLTEIFSVLSQVPGLSPRTLLALGGGGEALVLEQNLPQQGSTGFVLRLPSTIARFASENFRITERIEEFEGFYLAERGRIKCLDPRVLPAAALDRTLSDIELLLDRAGSIALTAYGNLLASVVALGALLRLFCGDDAERLQRDLLSGLADIDSAAPGISLWHIAEMAYDDEPARKAIFEADPSSLRVESLPDGPTRRALERFMQAHGYRGTREAEIAEPRWAEDPTLVFVMLKIHLGRERGEAPMEQELHNRQLRDAAEAETERRLLLPLRPLVRRLLRLAHRFMRYRERLRAYITEILGMFRTVGLEVSRRIVALEPEAGKDAAFYLTLHELHDVLRGRLSQVAMRVRQRRRQHERDRRLPDPEDTFVGYPAPVVLPPSDNASLVGASGSPGVVEGPARVVRTAAEAAAFQDGEILVVHCADVGWSPLFLVAGGVVTDLGGPLSHAAIVLREYGRPAVVNVKAATETIVDGDRLRVDGDRGEVTILERAVG